MAKGRITVLRAIPGSTSLGPILSDFAKRRSGTITAFSDSLLPACRQHLGDNSPVDVASFGEIVRNVLVLCGEDVLPIAQSGQKRAAIAYACGQLDGDSPFANSSRFSGFHDALGATIDELRHWGIDADAMDEMAMQVGPRLASKLQALAEVDRSVVETLDKLGRQLHSDHLMGCFDATPELEDNLDRLLVFAGAERDPLRIRWLKWLAGFGVDITVVLDRHATDAPIFAGAQQTLDLLGVPSKDPGTGNRLTNNLFAVSHIDGPPIAMTVSYAADPFAEVEWALRGCLRAGDLHRTAIYVRDLESYAPLIEAAAKRLGVQIRMARRAALLTNSFGRLTLSALKFCASSDVRTLSPVIRSSYLYLSGNAQAELDSMLRDCYVQRLEQWNALEAWSLDHVESHAWLAALLEWRRKAVAGVFRLTEWFGYLREFNRDQRLPWVTLENKGGPMDERDRRALNQMERILANHISVEEVTLRRTLSLREFVALCERLWSEGDVSIPFNEEGVRVAADPNQLGDADRLFVLGMLEGVFPRRRSEDPILTDVERAEISALRPDYPPLPDSRAKAQAERDEFYRVCAAALKEIGFSYPLADDQKDNISAFYLEEIKHLAGVKQPHRYPRPLLAPDLKACLAAADQKLRTAMDGPKEAPLPIELISEQVTSAIRPPSGTAFQPNVLRDVLQCPFQYLLRHVLRLRPKRRETRWSTLRKLPQVTQLLSKQDMADAERVMVNALNAQLDQLYADAPEWEMRLLRTGGQRLIRDWLHRETRSREEWPKEAGSVKVNVAFGTHGVRDDLPGYVRLEGSIAGISRLEKYNVAHLYGSSVSDPKNMTEPERLYYGLYLLAIHEPGREGALEIESMTGKRTLMVLGRLDSKPLASSVADGLQVVDLATSDDASQAKKEFFDAVKKALTAAVLRIAEVRVDATKGEHCDWCDYGELCRRSRAFGEDESPAGDEPEADDV